MNIGDKVTVSFVMEVQGVNLDNFSTEIMVNGKITSGEKGNFFVNVPQVLCKKIEQAHVV